MQLLLVIIWIAASIAFVCIFPSLAFNYYGIPCAIFNIINFGAPLAGIAVVLRRRCCDTLPFPLIVASVLVSAQWCAFGILQGYMEMIIPNGAGILLGLLQLSFFLLFPSIPGKHAPLGYYFACVRGLERQLPEKTPVVEYGIRSINTAAGPSEKPLGQVRNGPGPDNLRGMVGPGLIPNVPDQVRSCPGYPALGPNVGRGSIN
ncbi:sugar efflux transporter for intercellular exchange domain-containing protein [Ditylenchus destructor]|nr:sugar efflux transporter for intercellular exchange domain-containing protein [Ditylenchus destructor]